MIPPPVDQHAARKAAIDIGTNTVLLTIADWKPAAAHGKPTSSAARGELEILAEHARITRLGQGVDATGQLDPDAQERTLACLRDYAALCRAAQVTELRCVGTSALRDATGGESFRAKASALLGAEVEVISGQREAELTFFGGLSGWPQEQTSEGRAGHVPLLVFDIGGGSTELILGSSAGHIDAAHSMNVGSVRLCERYPADLDSAQNDIVTALDAFDRHHGRPAPEFRTALGLAGTVTTLWALARQVSTVDFRSLQAAQLDREEVRLWTSRLASLSLAERKALPGMEAGRADVLPYGALICELIMSHFGVRHLRVSDRGVRHGLLLEPPVRRP